MGVHYFASERRDLDMALADLAVAEEWFPKLLPRLVPYCELRPGADVLDIGAAQGIYVTALRKLGYDARGVEPFKPALETSRKLAEHTGIETEIREGWGEALPFEDEEFDLVIADSVMEHVDDPITVFSEIHRVLKPGGGFYFLSAPALAAVQYEIKGFPFFGLYPDRVRRRIMTWAMENRPSWVGHTDRPAIHWFTPWGARRDLSSVGFSQVIEQWDLKREEELEGWRRLLFKTVRSSRALRFVGEFIKPGGIVFLAVK